jgi:hypothetical protein
MKKYRIKNTYHYGYKVQIRALLIFWNTVRSFDCVGFSDKIFNTIEDAREWIKKDIETSKQIKESKYTEYL